MRHITLALVGVASLAISVLAWAQSASLDAPTTAAIASDIEVSWSGPGYTYDSIYVAETGGPDSAPALAKSTNIMSNTGPVMVRMPDTPGDFELRYYSAQDKKVLARQPITIEDVPASLDAPDEARIGQQLGVSWTGPGTDYDRIELHAKDASDDARALASASITGRKNPVNLTVPEESGAYELRYVTNQSGRILARQAIQVNEVAASIEAPDNADLGEEISIDWTGPGNSYDRIALYERNAGPDDKAVKSLGLLGKTPVLFRLPELPGEYELRYELRDSGRVLATRELTIGAVEAQIDAPARATASMPLEIGWEGPGNNYDLIGLFEPGAPDDARPLADASILSEKNPLTLLLPDREGEFELRYRTTQTGQVLARKAIIIEPAGRLAVVFERTTELQGTSASGAVELILDASGSMLQRDENGRRRIEIAREVLVELVRDYPWEDQPFALRVFGHKEADACRTDLEIPLGPLDAGAAADAIAGVNAMNLARTPIADSLARVPQDLAGAGGDITVILITDGEETCEGDPAAVIENLRSQGLDIQVSIVGFAIEDADLQATFESWAELGGGRYFNAASADELRTSLRSVISGPFRVFDQDGQLAGQGVIGGAEIVLPAGTYRVETVGENPRVLEEVRIAPRELTEVSF